MAGSSASGQKQSDPKVMHQSVDRPELWLHVQLNTSDFKSFRWSTVASNMLPPASNGGTAHAADAPTTVEAWAQLDKVVCD